MKNSRMLSALAALILVASQFFPYPVFADEFAISGNGEGSSNSINLDVAKSETVTQNNAAEVNNNIETVAQTGDNTASGNSGETTIETGDANTEVAIINSGNLNSVDESCCEDNSDSLKIIDNGSDTTNEINKNESTSNTIVLSNNLSLNTNILINTDTGNNEASDNGGDVSISTGGVNILGQLLNLDLNVNDAKVPVSQNSSNITVSGNGSGSSNTINDQVTENNQFFVTNSVTLNNDFSANANTGKNKAKGNKGKVFISTGSILLDIILANRINSNYLAVQCCNSVPPSLTPTPKNSPDPSAPPQGAPSPTPAPSCCTPTNDPPGPPGGSGGGGSSSGQVLGASLPATGGFSIWSLTFLALLMLIFGVILRSDAYFRKFVDTLRFYAFGIYLFANLKVVSPVKT